MPSKKTSKIPPAKLKLYEKLIDTDPAIERKGDVHPYTSVNGHMFSYLDQTGTMGLRLPKDELEVFLKKYKTRLFESYGVVKKDWATVPDSLLNSTKELTRYLKISFEYTKTPEAEIIPLLGAKTRDRLGGERGAGVPLFLRKGLCIFLLT